jgi:hypothetical protein
LWGAFQKTECLLAAIGILIFEMHYNSLKEFPILNDKDYEEKIWCRSFVIKFKNCPKQKTSSFWQILSMLGGIL